MPSAVRDVSKWRRSLAKRWNAWVFDVSKAANRQALWCDVCKTRAISDATQALQLLLAPACGVTEELVRGYLEELRASSVLRDSAARYRAVLGEEVHAARDPVANATNLLCYVAMRLLKPTTVVETGCAAGWSSLLFLLALEHNQQGHLYTIDLPPIAGRLSMAWALPEGASVGFCVPDDLRGRWTLIRGDVREELLPLLKRLGSIDVFHHDSDHSYEHMMWEYTSVWSALSSRGILTSDDIGWNTAFWDFATAVRRPFVIHRSNLNMGAMAR